MLDVKGRLLGALQLLLQQLIQRLHQVDGHFGIQRFVGRDDVLVLSVELDQAAHGTEPAAGDCQHFLVPKLPQLIAFNMVSGIED